MNISKLLSEQIFNIATQEQLDTWIRDVDKEIRGISWAPVGGIDNNVHTVEVASDPSLALVERPTNSIDALLDLRAIERGETASTPHGAAVKWWGVPPEGLSAMSDRDRRTLADNIRVTMFEGETPDRQTIVIQDRGTGQHPDDFPGTHVSLLASNKKSSTHVMGVYNAGGAASYKFAKSTIIVSRRAPTILQDRTDEIGITIVKYDPLDPDKFKSGVYVYMLGRDKSILRLSLRELPELSFGSYIKLVEYLLPKYNQAAYGPKNSLWHLFHAALPDPALPFRIIETRPARLTAKSSVERRVISGLLHLLNNPGTADYSDVRTIELGPEVGRITLRYFVLNEHTDPDAYTTADQGLTITLNGQRQLTKDRQWLRRQLELFYLFKRLVVLIDGTELTNAAKRDVFSSTRETGVDSPLTRTILDRSVQEMLDDENLVDLDEQAKQRTLEAATKTTTERVKKQLAAQIGAYLKGVLPGKKGGRKKKSRKRRAGTGKPQSVDDSLMLDIPTELSILTNPLDVQRGTTTPLRVHINAKNGFLPHYADGLSVVVGPELKDHVKVLSKGRLLGGRVRVTIEAAADAPLSTSSLKVALVVESLGILLIDQAMMRVIEPRADEEDERASKGGEPDIDVNWVGRDKWDNFNPVWNAETVGDCMIYRDDPLDKNAITKVEWVLNEAFGPYEKVIEGKKLGEAAMKTFREGYEYPVLFALFRQRLAEEEKEKEADEEGRLIEIPDDYVRGERARIARAVLMAMEPDIHIAEAVST